jgi:hypothetical protein
MPGAQKNFIGKEGFIWWIGVVEDRQDPEQLGRVRVRCFGWHSEDKELIPTDLLPWAHTVLPVNHPAAYTPKEGDMVMGFFMDGVSAQNPVVMGVIPGKPSKKPKYDQGFSDPRTSFENAPKKPNSEGEPYPLKTRLNESSFSRLSRNKADGTVVKTKRNLLIKNIKTVGGITWAEPQPAFSPTYPYNFVHESESGHAFELDDTPGKERVSLSHRTGSSFEYDAAGNKVEKIVKDNYYVLLGSDYIYVSGNVNITVDGNCNLKAIGNLNAEAKNINLSASESFKVKAAEVKIESTGALDAKVAGAAKLTGSTVDLKAEGAANFTGGGAVGIKGGGSVALTGSSVEVTSPLNVSGATNLTVSGSTQVASGSGPHTHGILKQPVTGSGASSAATASDASESGLEFTQVEPQTVPTSNTNTTSNTTSTRQATGKTTDGTTKNVSDSFNNVNEKVDEATKAVESPSTPAGELAQILNETAEVVNDSFGEIQTLTDNLQQIVYEKIDNLELKSSIRGIVTGISNEIIETANNFVNKTTATIYTVGKRTYPKTEVVVKSNTQSNTA